MFYNYEGKKIIPSNIGDLLTARGLAYWAQDDGNNAGSGFRIYTLAFSKEDNLLLIKILKDKFDLNCSIHIRKKNFFFIYIKSNSMENFKSLVTPYFHESMKNKL